MGSKRKRIESHFKIVYNNYGETISGTTIHSSTSVFFSYFHCWYLRLVLCVLCYCLVCILFTSLLSCVYSFYIIIVLCVLLQPHYCLVCIVVTSCVLLYCVCIVLLYILLAGLLASIQYPECPATSHICTSFLGFPVFISECWDGSQDSKLLLVFLMQPSLLKFLSYLFHIYVHA